MFPWIGAGEVGKTTVFLSKSDFAKGTVRLQKPGKYVLLEDIVFNPNPENDWRPKYPEQAELYPFLKYKLGFFSALTIEGDGILFDGMGHTVRQSREHYLQQRFFSCIELADQPFIPKQGPDPMADRFVAATRSTVRNVHLGLSSHHGIHGNGPKRILIQNVSISDFEISGIGINGGVKLYIEDVVISGSASKVPVRATYSQSRFLEPFWDRIPFEKKEETLNLRGEDKVSGLMIRDRLQKEMQTTFHAYVEDRDADGIPPLFANPSGVTDRNQYGIVLNVLGMMVNALPSDLRSPLENTNEDITLNRVTICDIRGRYVEVPALPVETVPEKKKKKKGEDLVTAYQKVQTGPVGDVFRFDEVTDEEKKRYKGDTLSDAQIFLSHHGFGNISEKIQKWAQSADRLTFSPYRVSNLDSMAHMSKGTYGVLIVGGKNVRMRKVCVRNLRSEGEPSVLNSGENVSGKRGSFTGNLVVGVGIAECTEQKSVYLEGVEVSDLSSRNGTVVGFRVENSGMQSLPDTCSVSGLLAYGEALSKKGKGGGNTNPIPKIYRFQKIIK